MRLANNAKISHQDRSNQGERKNPTPFVRNTASVLTIPRLNQNIQGKIKAGTNAMNLAGLALNLYRKGYIEETAEGETSQLIKEAIQKWVVSHTGELEFFDFSLEIAPELSQLEYTMYEGDLEEFQKSIKSEFGPHPMFLSIEPGNLPTIQIGKILQEIEDKAEGLGKTAYYWLATCGANCLNVFTPWQGSYLAEYTWWYHMESQEDFIEELSQYYDDEESIQAAMELSPDNWNAAFPTWVTHIEKPLSEDDLKIIANTSEDNLVTQVAKAVLALIKYQDAQLPDVRITQLDSVYSGMYLYWEEHDMSSRLIDDYTENVNMMGGEGYLETLGISPIPNKPFQFRRWMAEMEKGWIQLKNIEELVKLIGTRCN
jgi:PRTRC genetic system protein F